MVFFCQIDSTFVYTYISPSYHMGPYIFIGGYTVVARFNDDILHNLPLLVNF